MTSAVASPGLPVEIGRIDRELGRLWEESDDTKTRASLINLAVYTEDAGSIASTTELLAQIASEHACRAILIYGNPGAAESRAQAWISAHCHMVGKGRQICSEQITFQLDGNVCDLLPNIVFSHLDSDLPLYFWWQRDFAEPLDEKLWSRVDRLIYDSRSWRRPEAQFALAREIGALGDRRSVLCDLNWARLLSYRFGLASFFENPHFLPYLREIDAVQIDYSPGSRSTALLLLGWLARQLRWTLQSVLSTHTFRDPAGREVRFALGEKPGACISRCQLGAGAATFCLSRGAGAEFFQAETGGAVAATRQVFPAGKDRLVDTMLIELSRGGTHPLYLEAVEKVEPLFD